MTAINHKKYECPHCGELQDFWINGRPFVAKCNNCKNSFILQSLLIANEVPVFTLPPGPWTASKGSDSIRDANGRIIATATISHESEEEDIKLAQCLKEFPALIRWMERELNEPAITAKRVRQHHEDGCNLLKKARGNE